MPSVLVVDDSPVDRRLVSGLLSKNAFLQIELAASGADALAVMQRKVPDLVVTDLVMPGMDGFELVGKVRAQYPLVPVILMTSMGNEEIAGRALQEGAASYVPKRSLAQQLLDTVERVLTLSDQRRGQSRLLGNMTKSECAFVLENDCSLIPPLVGYLQESVTHMRLCDQSDRVRIGVALEEALVNALYHGNLEVSSAHLDQGYKAYYDLINQRSVMPPYRDRRIHVDVKMSRREAVFVIRDEGRGFDPSALPDPTDPTNLEKISGRGVLLMRTFMDDVCYNDVGNQVTLVKRAEDASPEPDVATR
jgi:CheY-like chemotaxis protein/anti-sigma regulatory factor (Ser/Thr protein kinase)